MGLAFSVGCNSDCGCRGNCADVLFASFDCGNCDALNTCVWWDQILGDTATFDGANWYTSSKHTLLLGPIANGGSPPSGSPACIALVGGDVKVITAGYVHMLPNSASATATINGNAAYDWYYYPAGTILTCTYQITTFGNLCLYCRSDPEICSFTVNDVTYHTYPF